MTRGIAPTHTALEAPREPRLKAEERRRRLAEATIASLARNGAQGAGVRQVCRDLQVAPSLVNHFFDGWNDLLVSAYRLLAERALEEYAEIAELDGAPARLRLRRLIERNVSPAWLSEDVVGAYVALWDLSRTVPQLKREFTRFHRKRRQIVTRLLAEMAGERRPSREIELMAAGLVVFMDGLWLELGLNPGNIPPSRAVQMCWLWIADRFPDTGRGRSVGAR
jgi:TetR/AcrR family transcriptional repressor of bet genes